ncbi:phage tail protein [Agrobacterium rhizogenes]|uniref:phage tail length tape measure family protein n=1 Tax=Rhizobium rhizogenes TaxID=359 RepID=UPI001571A42F|nr:phage tail length tape measure family protein [Rhizobium rhizogenes]NTG48966.1 phage tail protein [Rhizobium rhizogenes]
MSDQTDDLIISISTDLATVRRSLDRLVGDVGSATNAIVRKFDGVGSGINKSMTTALQARINDMVGIGQQGVKQWNGALADQGRQVDALRAKYNPLYATISQYKAVVGEIKTAHNLGAISADEMTAAIQRERQAALASIDAIKKRNSAITATITTSGGVGKANSFQTANIAAQFQDVAVTAAMGMNPLQIALQQGTQLSSVLATMGSGRQIVGGLAAAFTSLVSPVSLVTIGLTAAGAAAIQYFMSVAGNGEKSQEALEKEAELIQRVAEKWGDALPQLKRYADERQRLKDNSDITGAAASEADAQWSNLRKTTGDLKINFIDIISLLRLAGAEAGSIDALQRSFNELSKGVDDGSAKAENAKTVQSELIDFANATGIPAIKDFANQFGGLATQIETASRTAAGFREEAAALTEIVKNLPPLGSLNPVISGDGRLITDANEQQTYNAEQYENQDPRILSNGVYIPVPTPEKRPNIELEGLPGERFGRTRAPRVPQKTADDRFREDLQSIKDRSQALQEEIGLVGKSYEEQTKRRTALDLEQRALKDLREEARRKGQTDLDDIKLSPDKVAEIDKQSAAYAAQAEALRKVQEAQERSQQAADEFYQTFKSDTIDAITGAKSFGEALGDIGKKLGDMFLNQAFDALFKPATSNSSGGAFGNIFSSIGKWFTFADGGIAANGRPLKRFASGGVSSSAAIFGETGWPEAAVPLPDGRTIPVSLRMPKIAPRAANDSYQVTYAPVIDNRGADAAAVARLQQQMDKDRQEFSARVVNTMRVAKKTRQQGI